jgi:hypothetical protein
LPLLVELGEEIADEGVHGGVVLGRVDAGSPEHLLIDRKSDILHPHRICVNV